MIRLVLLASLAWLLGACASITTGTDQSILIDSDPKQAACDVQRAGGTVAVVKATPETVRVDKSAKSIAVVCRKPGYEDGVAEIRSELQGATFGNIIAGGIIGLAIDAGTGALNKYAESVVVLLVPASFPSVPDRDAYYARLEASLNEAFDNRVESARAHCRVTGGPQNTGCDNQVQAIENTRKSDLAALAAKRGRAVIRESTPAQDVAAAKPANPDVMDRLAKLKDLRDRNLITQPEYDKRRKEILGEI